MNPWDDLNKAMAVNKHLEAENARLRKQLHTAVETLAFDPACPSAAGLANSCDRNQGDCRECWCKALEGVE